MPNPIVAGVIFADNAKELQAYSDSIQIAPDSPMFSFLPTLDVSGVNPRQIVDVIDDAGQEWTFAFVCHKGELSEVHQLEYRLTGMMGFIQEFNLKTGDIIYFRKSGRETFVTYLRANGPHTEPTRLLIFFLLKTLLGRGGRPIQLKWNLCQDPGVC